MQSSARIEELRQKFHENPRRYFAPLANEYRKAGDPEQAIAICRAHLAQQPGHMSGHVVYGQALYDAGRMDEAAVVFQQALALDPENIIVLRHLGDIARRRGDVEEARSWYSRALDGDPHDAEIAAYLAELTEPLTTAPQAEAETPQAEAETSQAEPETPRQEYAPTEAEKPDETEAEAVAEPVAEQVAVEAEALAAAEDEGLAVVEGTDHDESLISPYAREMDLAAPSEMKWELNESPYLELVEASASDEAWDSITSVPKKEEATGDSEGADHADESVPSAEASASAETGAAFPPSSSEESETPPPAEPPTEPPLRKTPSRAATPVTESPPIVTRTLAELYLQQGYIEPALEIYRQLAEQEPGDTGLQERIVELSNEGASEPGRALEEVAPEDVASGEPAADTVAAEAESPDQLWDSADSWGDWPFTDVEDRDEVFGLTEDVAASPPEPMEATAPAEGYNEPEPKPEPQPEPQPQPEREPEREPEPKPEPEPPVSRQSITVREFFATLGSARPPSRDPDEALDTEEPVALSNGPEPVEELSAHDGYPIADDAFANLFAGVPLDAEDSRAAAVLSGAVAHQAPFSTQPAAAAASQSRDVAQNLGIGEPAKESEEDIRRFREWLDGLAES